VSHSCILTLYLSIALHPHVKSSALQHRRDFWLVYMVFVRNAAPMVILTSLENVLLTYRVTMDVLPTAAFVCQHGKKVHSENARSPVYLACPAQPPWCPQRQIPTTGAAAPFPQQAQGKTWVNGHHFTSAQPIRFVVSTHTRKRSRGHVVYASKHSTEKHEKAPDTPTLAPLFFPLFNSGAASTFSSR